jgi:hypothetical protein
MPRPSARGPRPGDRYLATVEQNIAAIGAVTADDAFDERALAGAILTEQRVQRPGRDMHSDVRERDIGAEALAHGRNFECCGAGGIHDKAASKAALSLTAPNTPPCIVTILSAAR